MPKHRPLGRPAMQTDRAIARRILIQDTLAALAMVIAALLVGAL